MFSFKPRSKLSAAHYSTDERVCIYTVYTDKKF